MKIYRTHRQITMNLNNVSMRSQCEHAQTRQMRRRWRVLHLMNTTNNNSNTISPGISVHTVDQYSIEMPLYQWPMTISSRKKICPIHPIVINLYILFERTLSINFRV